MIVHVLHPAPVLRIPARMRRPRFDWQGVVTPVELREASGAEAPFVDGLVMEDRLNLDDAVFRSFEGRLYSPMRQGRRQVTLAELVATLEGTTRGLGDDADWRRIVATSILDGTPLTVPYRGQPRDPVPSRVDDRGGELGPHRMVLRDGTAAASEAMREFADEDLLVVDGVPHRRAIPLARIARDATCARVYLLLHHGMASLSMVPTPPQAFEATLAAVAAPGCDAFDKPEGFDAWMALPPEAFGDRPARFVANRLPAIMRAHIDQDRLAAPDGVRDRLVELEGEGLVGLVRGAAVAPVLAECAAHLEAMRMYAREGETVSRWIEGGGAASVLATLREVLMPACGPDAGALVDDAATFAGI